VYPHTIFVSVPRKGLYFSQIIWLHFLYKVGRGVVLVGRWFLVTVNCYFKRFIFKHVLLLVVSYCSATQIVTVVW